MFGRVFKRRTVVWELSADHDTAERAWERTAPLVDAWASAMYTDADGREQEPRETMVADLICDLLHYVAERGCTDAAAVVSHALSTHEAERAAWGAR